MAVVPRIELKDTSARDVIGRRDSDDAVAEAQPVERTHGAGLALCQRVGTSLSGTRTLVLLLAATVCTMPTIGTVCWSCFGDGQHTVFAARSERHRCDPGICECLGLFRPDLDRFTGNRIACEPVKVAYLTGSLRANARVTTPAWCWTAGVKLFPVSWMF